MEQFEQEYIRRFSQEKQSVDPQEEAALWKAIEAQLPATPVRWWRKRVLWVWLALIGMGAWFLQHHPTSKNAAQTKTHLSEAIEAHHTQATTATQTAATYNAATAQRAEGAPENRLPPTVSKRPQQTTTDTDKNALSTKSIPPHNSQMLMQAGNNKSQTGKSQQMGRQAKIDAKNIFVQTVQPQMAQQEDAHVNTVPQIVPTNTTIGEETVEHALIAHKDAANDGKKAAPSLLTPLLSRSMQLATDLPHVHIRTTNIPPVPQKAHFMRWQVGLLGGVNATRLQYHATEQIDWARQRQETDHMDGGWSIALEVTKKWRQHGLLRSGLQYHESHTQFRYKSQKVAPVTLKDQLLQVWVNSNTGDTVQRRHGDTTVLAQTMRSVRYRNTYQQLSLPITVGWTGSKGRWLYDVTAGPVLTYTARQDGKTLSVAEEIVRFSQDASDAPWRAFTVGFQISPSLGYLFTRHWVVVMRPQWTWQPTAQRLPTFRTQAHQAGISVGLQRRF